MLIYKYEYLEVEISLSFSRVNALLISKAKVISSATFFKFHLSFSSNYKGNVNRMKEKIIISATTSLSYFWGNPQLSTLNYNFHPVAVFKVVYKDGRLKTNGGYA